MGFPRHDNNIHLNEHRRLTMGKVLFVLELPEPKLRKNHAPPSKRHKDASKYSRKQKHKAKREEAPDDSGASCFWGNYLFRKAVKISQKAKMKNYDIVLQNFSWPSSIKPDSCQPRCR